MVGRVVFRVDASLAIGTGHVMRCLTLARALREQGHACLFITREHAGNLNKLIDHEGFSLHVLPIGDALGGDLEHSHWLGASQDEDAAACQAPVAAWKPDWLVVDHYGLDQRWEKQVIPAGCRVLVIDDLADRRHACDLLLDQTFGRASEAYDSWVPENCRLLCGSRYALLRPEFAALRQYSLARRVQGYFHHLLVTMGGVDKDNATAQVLTALKTCELPGDCHITVVMGRSAPWLANVKETALGMPWPTEVQVDVKDMARLMADSDLAIGAAGATIWERCCLGVPAVMMVLANNQRYAAEMLERQGAARVVELNSALSVALQYAIAEVVAGFSEMSHASSKLVDGCGCQRVIDFMRFKGQS